MRFFSVTMAFLALPLLAQTDPPKEWVDADTGHRVIRLTDEPGSATLYFNQNWFTPDNKKLVYSSRTGIYTMNLATRETKQVVEAGARLIEVGHKNSSVYYTRSGSIFTTDIDSGVTREIAKLPARGSIATVNADETLAAGTYTEAPGPANNNYASPEQRAQQQPLEQPPNKGQMMEERLAAHIPMAMFVVNIKSGELTVIHRSTDWLNHLLFSPTDPALLMFCHEGPWHKVDRIWTIRVGNSEAGSTISKIHTRTMAMEIFGHEFWSIDGATIYYDLQTPRGEDFWLAAYKVATGERTWYHLQRNEWSIHFNVSTDGKLFCGDGGDPGQVAKAPDGEWIYLFRPEVLRNQGVDDKNLVRPGVLHAEKLVNMSKHKYNLEPNVRFSPDAKWVMFRSNMFGATYVFAVEVDKAK
jgi:oligogalacturonide lyase